MMKNRELDGRTFDVVIVGGGIHGSTLAMEAARAGYEVALLEKGDFGHSTSANSLKIIHGGIRYLQHGDFKRMRESIKSRRAMMNFSPHLVKPLACLMPTYGHGIRGREMMRLAFGIYDLVAFDRNMGLEPKNCLPCAGALSRDEVKRVVSGIKEDNLTGGAVWYDAIAYNTERLILEYVKEAARYGASPVNYIHAEELEATNGRVGAVLAKDLISGQKIRIGCRCVVNAAGPRFAQFSNSNKELTGQRWATAVNLVVKKRLFEKYAVGLEGYTDYTDQDAIIKRGKRLFFFVPWLNKYTMIGTTYKPYRGEIGDFSLQREEISNVLADVNKIYPQADLTMEDVTYFHGGLVPRTEAEDEQDERQADSVQLDKSSRIIDHGGLGEIKGLFSIKGVKYTTAPDIAQKVLKILKKDEHLGIPKNGSCRVDCSQLPDFDRIVEKLGGRYEKLRTHLRSRYGGYWRELFCYMDMENNWEADDTLWISTEPPLLKVELLYFIREELAHFLSDVVFRRSPLGSAECPEEKTLHAVADIMARELGWSHKERESQIDKVLAVYAPLKG